jgi:hypothetical protein
VRNCRAAGYDEGCVTGMFAGARGILKNIEADAIDEHKFSRSAGSRGLNCNA